LDLILSSLDLDRALVVLPPDDWRGWAAAARQWDPRPGADLLFVEGRANDAELFEIAGDRPVFIWDGRLLREMKVPSAAAVDSD
jgi:hypothetical protein